MASNVYGFKLIGSALLEFSLFKIDVYKISYYRSASEEKLVLDYLKDVKKKYSIMGWEKGLEHAIEKNPDKKKKFQWIYDNVVDLKKGDSFAMLKNKSELTFFKNGKKTASTKDPFIKKIIFDPWLGEKPVSDEIKKKLLKGLN